MNRVEKASENASATVLVVDDDPSMRASVCALLADDFRVVTATNVADAKAVLRRGGVDVVLTDQEMPDGTGLDLLKFVGERFPDTLVLVLTGHPELVKERSQGMRTSIRVIAKPFDPAALIRGLSNAAQLARMRQSTNRLSPLDPTKGSRPGTSKNLAVEQTLRVALLQSNAVCASAYQRYLSKFVEGYGRDATRLDFIRLLDEAALLNTARSLPVHLYIVDTEDLTVPPTDCLVRIRSAEGRRDVPVLFLVRLGHFVRPSEQERVACLVHPASFERLARALSRLLDSPNAHDTPGDAR